MWSIEVQLDFYCCCCRSSWCKLKREEHVKVKQNSKQAQGQISLPLSLSSYSDPFCFTPHARSPSFFQFLSLPAPPYTPSLLESLADDGGWNKNEATGRKTACTSQDSDKQKETPSDFPPCLQRRKALIHFGWCANTVLGGGAVQGSLQSKSESTFCWLEKKMVGV